MRYRKYEKKLSRLQWLNRHKQIGSANWKYSQVKIDSPFAPKNSQHP